jgi:hypothetical protein
MSEPTSMQKRMTLVLPVDWKTATPASRLRALAARGFQPLTAS